MLDETLSRLFASQWVVLLVVLVLLLLCAEAGYRLGARFRERNEDAAEGHSGSVQGAVLGLLGLLLGFSFAMAVGRYDARRSLVVDEANSISTTWLRADLLPSAQREAVRSLLRKYVVQRLEQFAKVDDDASMAAARREASAVHTALWKEASTAAAVQPTPLTASFIASLNETIDLESSRVAALRNHVPGAVWLLLMVVAGCGAWASGYGGGTGGLRSSFSQIVFPLLIAVVITLTADIDRPQKGIIGISQQPLRELLESMD